MIEEVKPNDFKNYEIEYHDISKLISFFWAFQTNGVSRQDLKSRFFYWVVLLKTRVVDWAPDGGLPASIEKLCMTTDVSNYW